MTPAEEECRRQVQSYQSRFPSVPTMTSRELLELGRSTDNDDLNKLVVVDVRSKPERQVSMIPGSIALEDLEFDSIPRDERASVVTYCTIGYRSGIEARRLQKLLPETKVYSLDGILAYSHTGEPLVDPSSGQTTNEVHAFAKPWQKSANPDYQTRLFDFPAILGRLVQVGVLVVWRGAQHVGFLLFSKCCHR